VLLRPPGSEVIRLAVQVVVRNKGRSLLTMLGLAIGVGAFIAMVSFGEGARSSVVSQFERIGTNLLRVRVSGSFDPKPHRPLTDGDLEALTRESTTLLDIVPLRRKSDDVVFGGVSHRVNITGVIPGYAVLHDQHLVSGGMFDELDVLQRAKVCVLGQTPARALFGDRNPLGATITIGGTLLCRVLGLVASKGASISGDDLDDFVLMPVTTFAAYLGNPTDGYYSFELRPQSPALLQAARGEIVDILRRRHQLDARDPDDFDVSSPDEETRVAARIAAILTGLLAGIAAVSLLVGGIGIMNILLVSIAERTYEIGIRAAVGASPGQILTHFLAEALVLAIIGSAAGGALGVGAALAVEHQMGWDSGTSVQVVVFSVLFGIVIGLVFGYIPARRAAMLDPIQALRHE
jgi:putative ABC transport system permease protein